MAIRTFGHGTLAAGDLVELLRGAGVEVVADVRRHPGSRRHPHTAREAMERWLREAAIDYAWLPALGGRRRPDPASPNVGLRDPQFRGYADHMASAEFAAGAAALHDLGAGRSVAVMCAESVWWRCHRRLLADHLVLVDGVAVGHLFHDGRTAPHEPTAGATVEAGAVVYRDPGPPALF